MNLLLGKLPLAQYGNTFLLFRICFLGKKRGASLRIAGVSVNAPSLLKHEAELEPLADAIPTSEEERKKYVTRQTINNLLHCC